MATVTHATLYALASYMYVARSCKTTVTRWGNDAIGVERYTKYTYCIMVNFEWGGGGELMGWENRRASLSSVLNTAYITI